VDELRSQVENRGEAIEGKRQREREREEGISISISRVYYSSDAQEKGKKILTLRSIFGLLEFYYCCCCCDVM
jgi:hypothetical protein